jgi:hypothetical protein
MTCTGYFASDQIGKKPVQISQIRAWSSGFSLVFAFMDSVDQKDQAKA